MQRISYYAHASSYAKERRPDYLDDNERHVRHCFDYLRQSLMCAADGTLEPVDFSLGGVTGWGVKRQCRDYEALKLWAEERRASNSLGFGHR